MSTKTIGSGSSLSSGYAAYATGFTLTNFGTIAGPGVYLHGSSGTVINSGSISGSTNGIVLGSSGGAVTNLASGVITGAGGNGVAFNDGGLLANQADGTIRGGFNGVAFYNAAGTVVNGGTIIGSGFRAVSFAPHVANRLVVSPYAVFTGSVYGGGSGVLELTTGFGFGTISSIGTKYTGFDNISIDQNAFWFINGTNSVGSGITLTDGGVLINGSTLGSTVTVTGTGELVNDGGKQVTAATAVLIAGAGGYVSNGGLLAGNSASGVGVSLQANGTINNEGGTITGSDGVLANALTRVTVVNQGSIGGTEGVFLFGSASVTNQAGGRISGSVAAVGIGSGAVTNQVSAVISGGEGITGLEAVTVQNAGTISGSGGKAIALAAGYANRVVVEPGAVFNGTVDGGNTFGSTVVSTLEFATSRTLAGGHYINFGSVIADAGVDLQLNGSYALPYGISFNGNGTITNAGSVSGLLATFVSTGGVVINTSSGTVTGLGSGVQVAVLGGRGTLFNSGWLGEPKKYFHHPLYNNGYQFSTLLPVYMKNGGLVSNAAGGTISAEHTPVAIRGSGTVINAGVLHGYYGVSPTQNQAGVIISGGGTVINSGYIIGYNGVVLGPSSTVDNSGVILGTGITPYFSFTPPSLVPLMGAVVFSQGGTLINRASGTIGGGDSVILAFGNTTIENAGRMGGIQFVGLPGHSYTDQLIIDPGAVFNYSVNIFGTINSTLELASGAAAGTLSGLGTKFSYLAETKINASVTHLTTIDAGATWTLTGSNSISSNETLANAGSLILSGATLSDAGALTNNGKIVLDPSTLTAVGLGGSGSVIIEGGSTLDVQGAVASSQGLTFAGGGYLHLGDPTAVLGSIVNLGAGDTIDLEGITQANLNFSGGALHFPGGAIPLSVAGGVTPHIGSSSDGALVALCFCVNTMILTPQGQVAVQHLAIGDQVMTLSGIPRPIVWIGTGEVGATRGRRNAATPVIVRKGALADHVPNIDLHLTKGHALFLDGVLIPVEELVNHRSIVWDDRAQDVEIYHIELETHDVLIANGASAESYRDDGNRWLFANANSQLHAPTKLPCAPLLTGGAIVDQIWQRLLDRTGARAGQSLTEDADLHLFVDGRRIDALERRGDVHVFRLGSKPRRVRLRSRSAVPQELGVARDQRELGIAVRRLVLMQARRRRCVEASVLEDEGYHAYEETDGIRWTNGDALVPLELFAGMSGPAMLMVEVGGRTRYLDEARVSQAA